MKLKRPHFEKLKSLTKKQKKLILAGIALLLLILAACYTVFIAPYLQKEQWIYKEETVERGTLKVGVTESGSLEYNTKSVDYDLDLDVSDDDDDSEDGDDDDDTVQKYLKIEEIYAASGQRITEGEELLKFTEDSVEAVRALLQNAVVEAQADYAEAESTYELSLLEAQTDYDTQKISASYAASIRNTSGTSVTNNVASLQVQLEQKQANTASLQEKLTEAQEDYQDALETYEAAKEDYENAGMDNTVNYMVFQSGYLSARSQYQQAKSALTQAETAVADNENAITDLQNQDHRIGHKPNELSGGQKQRVSIARALVGQPAILLADEPTGALDQTSGKEVLKLFRELNDMGNTIVMITHDLSVAQSAKRIVRIVDGQLHE